MNKKSFIAAALVASSFALGAKADFIGYTDWTTSSAAGVNATAGGTLSLSSGTVNVSYNGEFAFTQLNNSGINYWTEPNSLSKPYTGNAIVGNTPFTTDIIALSEQDPREVNTLSFSQSVHNPIMLINSLGAGNTVSYNFNQPFILLSAGQGYWGGNSTTLTETGNSLNGTEGAGAIEFLGDVDSISWTTTGGEYWNGFTIGAETNQPSRGVPDGGASLGLLGMSVTCLLAVRRKLQ